MNEMGFTLSFYTTDHSGAGGIFFFDYEKVFFFVGGNVAWLAGSCTISFGV